ncbi:hypothetical protein CAPTEDRAFT_204100 [Capitella teleta]|uniref:Sulfotransferase domain-containing protein n=1 Tax=Capitella teleta TaxID=283909 RepID=R7UN21_CAPTE|nr:hypothetical protein CAPTEDRAFT_204100 [Capitella teleta]|eukprot:ELU07488.1 hypothetical protein CAPTEDRAFT_204100 [Capitella teleta]
MDSVKYERIVLIIREPLAAMKAEYQRQHHPSWSHVEPLLTVNQTANQRRLYEKLDYEFIESNATKFRGREESAPEIWNPPIGSFAGEKSGCRYGCIYYLGMNIANEGEITLRDSGVCRRWMQEWLRVVIDSV